VTIVYIAAGGVTLVLIANIIIPAALKVAHRRAFLRRMAASQSVHLTFDDGPNPETTPRLLELLRQRGVVATFFLVGSRAEKHPELVRQIRRDGHRIGSHGYDHTHAWKTAPWSTTTDLRAGEDALTRILDEPARGDVLFRPPYGKLNLGSLRFLSERTSWWDVDPRDYECSSGSEVFDRLHPAIRPGSVVLLHDNRPSDSDSAGPTLDAVELLLDFAEAQNLAFAALPRAT